MPKNKGKGGKNRRRGKNDAEGVKRELAVKGEQQVYGQVLKMLGNGRLEAYCFDGTKRLCHIRGKMRKKVWVNSGDIVLVSLREFQDSKADVILKYNPDEARQLKAMGELPDTAKINDVDMGIGFESGDEKNIEFQHNAESTSSDDDDDGSDYNAPVDIANI